MEIGSQGLLSSLQSVAEPSVNNTLKPTTPSQDFSTLLSDAINHVNELQGNSSELTTALELGDKNVTLADAMIAKEKASVAFEATMQVRNNVVDAYKEIMSMPV